MEKKSTVLLTIIIVLIVVLFIISVYKKLVKPSEESVENLTELQLITKIVEDEELDDMRRMSERDRIDHYFSKFVKAIESQNYSKAYNMLASTFKANYFKTEKEFTEYAMAYFPKNMSMSYDNIERNDNTYILFVTMGNISAVDKNSDRKFNVVIRENAINDFEMSFSVDKEYLPGYEKPVEVPVETTNVVEETPIIENTVETEVVNETVDNVSIENVVENSL